MTGTQLLGDVVTSRTLICQQHYTFTEHYVHAGSTQVHSMRLFGLIAVGERIASLYTIA